MIPRIFFSRTPPDAKDVATSDPFVHSVVRWLAIFGLGYACAGVARFGVIILNTGIGVIIRNRPLALIPYLIEFAGAVILGIGCWKLLNYHRISQRWIVCWALIEIIRRPVSGLINLYVISQMSAREFSFSFSPFDLFYSTLFWIQSVVWPALFLWIVTRHQVREILITKVRHRGFAVVTANARSETTGNAT